jgi:dipicolinate synthase subunit A
MLAHILTALGASVTVCARRPESRAWAACEGCRTLSVTSITDLCYGYDVIYNTVPSLVLRREVLLTMDTDTLLLDLACGASPEVIRECAESRGLRYVRAPSLPGRYAPAEAGRIISDCILSHLSDAVGAKTKGGQGI